jgi:predicted DNA-binding ribbon-helix-helix protein
MWDALNEICARERRSLHDVCTGIDRQRRQSGLTAAVRVFILNYFREAATEEGHARLLKRRDASAPGTSAPETSAPGTSAPDTSGSSRSGPDA